MPSRQKLEGIHYTPEALARFMAEQTAEQLGDVSAPVVLDPACGDGELLLQLGEILLSRGIRPHLVGMDRDRTAIDVARERLRRSIGDRVELTLHHGDFLESVAEENSPTLDSPAPNAACPVLTASFDAVIANPPYVRTQHLGAREAQRLGRLFGLTGRVDMFHAFVMAILRVMKDGAALGLLTSNRFMTVKSGARVREALAGRCEISRIIDLGDTRLFKAAVLPAFISGRRSDLGSASIPLTRIYVDDTPGADSAGSAQSVVAALRQGRDGHVTIDGAVYHIANGTFDAHARTGQPWVTAASDDTNWLALLDQNTHCRFGDVGKIRVGIKSTADSVFIQEEWSDSQGVVPEADLLHPLLTHRVAQRWRARQPSHRVLYPYDMSRSKRTPLDLSDWPKAAAYLEGHKARLAGRTYVIEAGREWWELWVPQRPDVWKQPKIVFPDISDTPRFFLDESGAIVNGDCYWVPIADGQSDMAALMLGVANSTLASRFYDARCGNKLYAGRRRYITQYVAEFPLPEPTTQAARSIVRLVRELLSGDDSEQEAIERRLDDLVWDAFGIPEEIRR